MNEKSISFNKIHMFKWIKWKWYIFGLIYRYFLSSYLNINIIDAAIEHSITTHSFSAFHSFERNVKCFNGYLNHFLIYQLMLHFFCCVLPVSTCEVKWASFLVFFTNPPQSTYLKFGCFEETISRISSLHWITQT